MDRTEAGMALALDVIPGFTVAQVDALGSMLGGVGSVAAFAATLVLIWREVQARRRSDEERAEERRDEERQQARLVFASLKSAEMALDDDQDPAEELPDLVNWSIAVEVTNYSQEPIHEAQVRLPGVEGAHFRIGRVGPGQTGENGGSRDADPHWQTRYVGCGGPASAHWLDLDVAFVDNSGRIWSRSGRDEPRRLSEMPRPY